MTVTDSTPRDPQSSEPAPVRAADRHRRAERPAIPLRILLILPAGVALLAGLDAGLQLLGVWAPITASHLADLHGMLMVLGFVGTVIALERAVALGAALGYISPLALGIGGLLLLLPATTRLGGMMLALGCAGLVAIYVPLWQRQRDSAVAIQGLGAVFALGSVTLWLFGVPAPMVISWLATFVILTIAGERWELARITVSALAGTVLVITAFGVCLGSVAALLWPRIGGVLYGVTLLALAGWLITCDVARKTVRGTGLPRFVAAAMLSGQAWLAVAGAVWAVGVVGQDGAGYDAAVHAVFLGFTISMIVAHAPVILPAVTKLALPYRPIMYLPLLLLHAALLLRLWLGDGLGWHLGWQLGGALAVLALLAFVGINVVVGVGARRRDRARKGSVT